MAKFVLVNASITVNGVDLSDHCRSVEINQSAADVEATCMGATGVGRLQGLRDESFVVTWAQDFASSKVDATLNALYSAGTAHTVVVKATSAAVSATNPKWTATCLLLDYNPIAGKTGDLAEAPTTFKVDGVITRAEA